VPRPSLARARSAGAARPVHLDGESARPGYPWAAAGARGRQRRPAVRALDPACRIECPVRCPGAERRRRTGAGPAPVEVRHCAPGAAGTRFSA